MNNVLKFIQENWQSILLVESTVASLIPVKYNGLMQGIWTIIQKICTPKQK